MVSGPAGSGKTTLAHALAQALGCPAVCRDEIKEGMIHALGREYEAAPGDLPTRRASTVFFEILQSLLEARATVIAEAAFQDPTWRPNLERLADLARVRVVRCGVDPTVGRQRLMGRPRRAAHADTSVVADAVYHERFVAMSLAAPTIDVDTSDGYKPSFDQILSFLAAE